MNRLWLLLGLAAAIGATHLAIRANDEAAPLTPSEIARLYAADQASRQNFLNQTDEQLQALVDADRLRRAQARTLYDNGALKTAADFYAAAMIFQHGESPEDYLLAHELSVASLALGDRRARWLAAATEDRFLRSIGREQRFATQYVRGGNDDGSYRLHSVQPGVTDQLRAVLDCPALDEARQREAEFNAR